MRLLVTGASGLLGGRLALLLAGRHTVVAGRHTAAAPIGLETLPLDLCSHDSLASALATARPEVVVHTAACADVDVCEREPETARLLNTLATERLAALCRQRGCRLIALSTDLVLTGDRAMSDESVAAAPILEYGRSKRTAEEVVIGASSDFAVLRVALVLGRGYGPRATASEGIAWALCGGRRVRLFSDQYRTPVDPESLANAIGRIVDGRGAGLFQLGGPERLSRYDLGLRVAQALGLDAGLIESAEQRHQPVGVIRPADCSMDCSRARRELGWEPRPLEEAIRESRRSPE